MKHFIFLLSFLIIFFAPAFTRAAEADSTKIWEVIADGYYYFLPDGNFFLPVIRADKDKIHFEGRYNYENKNTFSGWAGYNITGGNKIEYTVTPMAGIIVGDTKGIAPGLEATINYKKFEFYTEAEYLFDLNSKDESYFYNWANLTYNLKDWLWFGLSGQRLRSYNSDLDYQRGITVGGGSEKWEINGYFFNIDIDSPFYVAGLTYKF